VPRLRKLLVAREAVIDFRSITEPLRSEVIERMKLLARFPNIGGFVPSEIPDVRATTVGIFRIFYRVTARGVEVIFIRHCKRRVPNLD
jgi:plasmid stabilization system protein ParE